MIDARYLAGALAAGLQIYVHAMRRSGRTSRMIDLLKDGDQVVTISGQHAEQLRRELRERKLEVRVIAVPEPSPGAVLHRVSTASGDGKTYFDHSWIESYFAHSIDVAAREFDQLVSATGGWQEAHEDTRLAAARARNLPQDFLRSGR